MRSRELDVKCFICDSNSKAIIMSGGARIFRCSCGAAFATTIAHLYWLIKEEKNK